MPRQGRLHILGGYYHVTGRGMERRRTFDQNEDNRGFLSRLGEGLERTQSLCLQLIKVLKNQCPSLSLCLNEIKQVRYLSHLHLKCLIGHLLSTRYAALEYVLVLGCVVGNL